MIKAHIQNKFLPSRFLALLPARFARESYVCAGQAVTQCGHMWYEYGSEYHFKLLECDNIAFRSKQEVFIKCIPPAKGNKYLLFKQCIIFLLKFPLFSFKIPSQLKFPPFQTGR